MNILKCFILILFALNSVCISSQKHGLPVSIINYMDSQLNGSNESYISVIDGMIYNRGGIPCNGFQTDYYDEDKKNIRLAGEFKNGVPIGEVKGYYKSGAIMFCYFPYKKKYKYCGQKYMYCLYKEYDEQGNCTRYTDDKKGVEMKYRQDGSLISVLYYYRKRSVVKYFVEYFTEYKKRTVITKGNKYDYDENGRLRRHWVRKSESYDKKYGTLSGSFYFVEYDVSDNISRTGRFYSNLYEHDRWLHVAPEFPENLDSVSLQDFKEIINVQAGTKDVYKWDYANNKTIITTYRQRGNQWLEKERKSLPRVEVSND